MKLLSLFTLASLTALPLAAQAAPVGMVAHLSGSASMVQGANKTPLRLLGRIEDGATVETGANSNAVIVLFGNGARFQLGANASARVSASNINGARKLASISGPSAGVTKLLGEARVGAVLARPPISFQRLAGNTTGFLVGTAPRFDWEPIPGAARYSFSLLDSDDNIVWSTTAPLTSAAYPTTALPLQLKQPYTWKVSAFSASGKRLQAGRWGIITLLSDRDAATLTNTVNDLRKQLADAPEGEPDNSVLSLLVETYRSYGVLNGVLETLEEMKLKGEEGAEDAENEVLDSLSPFTRVLAGRSVQPTALN